MAATEGQSRSKGPRAWAQRLLRWLVVALGVLILVPAGALLLLIAEEWPADPATWRSDVSFYVANATEGEIVLDRLRYGGEARRVRLIGEEAVVPPQSLGPRSLGIFLDDVVPGPAV
jgi:hypothetical protein